MATSGIVLRQPELADPAKSRSIPLRCNGADEDYIQIFLALGKSLIPMRILTSDTIASVKMRIQSKRGMYVKQHKLIHAGRELSRDDTRVKEYGIQSRDVIHLVLRLSEITEVLLKSGGGREYMLEVGRKKMNKKLRSITISQDQQHEDFQIQSLTMKGKRLDDERKIDELVLEDDAVVHVVASKSSSIFRARHAGRGETELSIEDNRSKNTDEVTDILPGIQSCQPEELLPDELIRILSQVNLGLHLGLSPVLSTSGTGGAYRMMDGSDGKPVAIFKPMDEEPMAENNPRGLPLSISGEGLKRGTIAGQGALREVAAFILDHPRSGPRSLAGNEKNEEGFAGVPPTMMVRCRHPTAFTEPEKLGSLQKFVYSMSDCEDMGPARFPADEVHKIAILDIRLANTDRNGSNILVCPSEDSSSYQLVPIDHGYCLPHKFEDCTYEWLSWSQSRVPFSEESLNYISSLDAEKDLTLLEEHGWHVESGAARTLRISTMFLKKAAAAGLTAYEIGSMMCREALNTKSDIEKIVDEVEACVLPESSEETYLETLEQVIDFHLAKIR